MSYLKRYALENIKYEAPKAYDLVTKETTCQNIVTAEVSAADLARRLRDDISTSTSESGDVAGLEFQFVVHNRRKVDRVTSQLAKGLPFPFDREDYGAIADALKLPSIWPHYFRVKQAVPLMVQDYGAKIDMILQTPAYPDCFISMALSFDKITKSTTGYLHLMITQDENDQLDQIFHGMAHLAAHPLLLPAVLYHILDKHYRDIVIDIDDEMKDVMKNVYYSLDKENLFKLLDKMVNQHARLTRSMFAVISQIGSSLMEELSKQQARYDASSDATLELMEFVQATFLATQSRLLERDRLVARIEVQLQVLYNYIAQVTADLALEDNKSSLKIASYGQAISVVALIFLPMTAIAGFFSMGPFFSSQDNKLQVSKCIWIYFAVTAPLTLLVVAAWIWYTKQETFLQYFGVKLDFKGWFARSCKSRLEDEEEGKMQTKRE